MKMEDGMEIDQPDNNLETIKEENDNDEEDEEFETLGTLAQTAAKVDTKTSDKIINISSNKSKDMGRNNSKGLNNDPVDILKN